MGTLRRSERDGVAWWRSPTLAALGVPHGFSTRRGGVSAAPFDSLNLGRAGGIAPELSDPPENRAENLRRFQAALGLAGHRVARIHQVHGAAVVDASGASVPKGAAESPLPQADALVSAGRGAGGETGRDLNRGAGRDASREADGGTALMVTVADCAPVLLACARSGVIAAVHAGWRGVVAGVVPAALERMTTLGADLVEIRAAIGPCIGVDAFEVGDEVVAAFDAAGLGAAVIRRPGRRAVIDLARAVALQLERHRVDGRRVDRFDGCTVRDRDDFFSHRRDGGRSGRMAALIAAP